jgi:hypothetical protein
VTAIGTRVVPSIRHELERGVEATRIVAEAALTPARLFIDAYDVGIRIATDLQLSVASAIRVEPVRALVASSANLTRDIGAAQLSTARWFLDA